MRIDPKQVKLLVVEDDEGDYMMIERAFAKSRLVNEKVHARDGAEALEILRGGNGRDPLPRPYIILCDIRMPRMDGLTFLGELRKDPSLTQATVFMLTTSKHDEDKHRAYDLNVAGYILKNNAGSDFLSIVELIGDYIQVVELP